MLLPIDAMLLGRLLKDDVILLIMLLKKLVTPDQADLIAVHADVKPFDSVAFVLENVLFMLLHALWK